MTPRRTDAHGATHGEVPREVVADRPLHPQLDACPEVPPDGCVDAAVHPAAELVGLTHASTRSSRIEPRRISIPGVSANAALHASTTSRLTSVSTTRSAVGTRSTVTVPPRTVGCLHCSSDATGRH